MNVCLLILDKIQQNLAREQYKEAVLATGDLASHKRGLFSLVEGFAYKEMDSCNIADGLEKIRVEKVLRDAVKAVLIASAALTDAKSFVMELIKPPLSAVSNAKAKAVKAVLRAKATVKSARMVMGYVMIIIHAINIRDKRKPKNDTAENAMDAAYDYINFFVDQAVKEAPVSVVKLMAAVVKTVDVKSEDVLGKLKLCEEVVAEVSRWHKAEEDEQLREDILFVTKRSREAAEEASTSFNIGAPPAKHRKTIEAKEACVNDGAPPTKYRKTM